MNSNEENAKQTVNFNNLVKWCREKGCFIHNSIIRKKNKLGFYGIIATDRIEKGTTIFSIPYESCLNIDNTIKYEGSCESEKEKMVINFLIEYKKGTKSKLLHTLPLLPKVKDVIRESIYNCNEEIQKKIKEIGYNIEIERERWNKLMNNIIKLNNEYKYIENLSKDDIIYSMNIINSYSWNTFDPIMCFMNHKTGSPKRTLVASEEGGRTSYRYQYTTEKTIEKNEEIFDTYGDFHTTESLAMQYNFVDTEKVSTSIFFETTKMSTPIGFYKFKLLIDYGKKKNVFSSKMQKYFVQVKTKKFGNAGKLTVSETDIKDFYNVCSILSINNVKDIENRNILQTKLFMKTILQQNLKLLNQEKINKYIEDIRKQYPHIAFAIENRQKILGNILNKINDEVKH